MILLHDDKREPTAFANFTAKVTTLILLLLMGAMLALSLPAEDRLSVKVSDDAGWVQ